MLWQQLVGIGVDGEVRGGRTERGTDRQRSQTFAHSLMFSISRLFFYFELNVSHMRFLAFFERLFLLHITFDEQNLEFPLSERALSGSSHGILPLEFPPWQRLCQCRVSRPVSDIDNSGGLAEFDCSRECYNPTTVTKGITFGRIMYIFACIGENYGLMAGPWRNQIFHYGRLDGEPVAWARSIPRALRVGLS
jgi:hypothetical protein